MIVDKVVKIKWNGKNKNRLIALGYKFTKMNDYVEVKLEDLSHGSKAMIRVKCDYCGKIFTRAYDTQNRLSKKDFVHKDCCGDKECTTLKAKDTLIAKYGTCNIRQLDFVNEKISKTNIEKYGCENPFGNDQIKQKIKDTNLEKYGFESYSKTEDFKITLSEKMIKYIKEHPEKILSKDKHPRWIGDAEYKRSERATNEYNTWRKQVYIRDNYTCQCCKMKRTKSTQPSLNAHHILNFSNHEDLRFSVDNGITLCENCHTLFHKIYGKKNNNLEQLQEFIKMYNIDE